MDVLGHGTVILEKEGTRIGFSRTLYIPGLATHLLSVTSLLDEPGISLYGIKGSLQILKDGNTLLTAVNTPVDKLFKVDMKPVLNEHGSKAKYARAAAAKFPDTVVSAELWHKRLGHLGYSSIGPLSHMVHGIPTKLKIPTDICDTCALVKQTMQPRVSSKLPRADTYLYRVHTDLCGPMQTRAIGGGRYALLATDEYTGFTLHRILKTKDEVEHYLPLILDEFERDTHLKVKNLRADNGGEFSSTVLLEYLQNRNIYMEPTPPYSPPSNGMAERANRTMMDKVRALLYNAKLPKSFWGEAYIHANLLRNLSPRAGQNITPWEARYGTTPDLSVLRVFGSLAYLKTPDELRKKLDNKARKCIC